MSEAISAKKHGIVKIQTPAARAAGFSAVVTQEGGEPLHGIMSATVTIHPDKVITAHLDMCCAFEGGAAPRFWLIDPRTGARKTVAHVAFEDGSFWAAGEPMACSECRSEATRWKRIVVETPRDGRDRCFVKGVAPVCAEHES